jgi:hypothetical protein
VGEVNLQDLTLSPLFTVTEKELEERGVKGLSYLTVDPAGARLAMTAEGEAKDFLLLCTLTGLEQALTPDFPLTSFTLSNPQWSPDGKTLYVAVLGPAAVNKKRQYFVGEIPVRGGPARLTPVAEVEFGESFGDSSKFSVLIEVSLSPDGDTLATTTAFLEKNDVAPEARGLYLVDLRDPERKVTFVPGPQQRPRPVPPAAKE